MTISKRSVLMLGAALGFALILSSSAYADSSSSLLPQSDGNYTQWTPSAGTSHFALVDEGACNGATDYNSTTVVGNRDSYGVSVASIPDGAVITKIEIKPCASRVSTGGTNPVMNVFYRYGGVDSVDAGAYSLSGLTPADLATTTFSGTSLLKTATSTLDIGAILTSGTKGAKLSRVAAVLTYSPLLAPTNLSATTVSSTTISLHWTDNATSTESGSTVERSTDNINWSGIATTTFGATSYTSSGLTLGVQYYYRVRAFNFGGYSSYG